MTTLQKVIAGIVGLAIIVLVVVGVTHKSSKLGDATVSNYPTWYYNGIVIGKDNDLINNLDFGQCTPTGFTSIASLHQETVTCVAPNVQVGDKIIVNSENNHGASTNGGTQIASAHVGSLGVIDFDIVNNLGSTVTPNVGPVDYASFR